MKSRIRDLYSVIRTENGKERTDSLLHAEPYTLSMAYDSKSEILISGDIVKTVMNRKKEQMVGLEDITPVEYISTP